MTTQTDRGSVVPWPIVAVVAAPIVFWAFNQGVTDWQYQSAGLADPFLGRPAPGFTVAIGLMATGLVAVVRAVVGRSGGQPANETRARPRWWIPLAAGWVAYALAGGIVAAGGGSRTYDATMRYTFGAPIGAPVEVPATCTTPVGKPALLARVAPRPEGLFRITLLNVATGRQNPWPQPDGAFVELAGSTAPGSGYAIPNVPARPLPYILMTKGDGTTESEPPVGILGAYDYRVASVDDHEMTGSLDIVGTRFPDPFGAGTGPGSIRWVNLEVTDDPWPQTLTVTVSWECRP